MHQRRRRLLRGVHPRFLPKAAPLDLLRKPYKREDSQLKHWFFVIILVIHSIPQRCWIWVALRPRSRLKVMLRLGPTRGFHVRPSAILLRGFSPSCRFLHFACIFKSHRRPVQHRSRRRHRACNRRTRVLAPTRQGDQRPALGLSSRWPPQMLVSGRRAERHSEEAGA